MTPSTTRRVSVPGSAGPVQMVPLRKTVDVTIGTLRGIKALATSATPIREVDGAE
jgi:hypothetical protein